MTIEEVITVLAMQEEILQFGHLPMKTHGLLETLLWQKPEKESGYSCGDPAE